MHVSKSNIPTTTHLALKQVGIFSLCLGMLRQPQILQERGFLIG